MISIFIPSRGRPDRQPTAEALQAACIPFRIVCTKHDPTLSAYKRRFDYLVYTVNAANVAEKRQAIFTKLAQRDKIIMVDDDLRFYARAKDGSFHKANFREIRKLFAWFDKVLSKHAHAGLVDKFMCQAQPRGMKSLGRYNQVLGYNRGLIASAARLQGKRMPTFRLTLNQEHDMHLQLLVLGLEPAISCEFSKDGKYYAKGGCSNYRTPALERRMFKELKRLWPNYVKLRAAPTSIGGVGANFNWRKALEDGRAP